MRMRRAGGVLVAVVLATGLAACGDDGDDGPALAEVEREDDGGSEDIGDLGQLSDECRVFAEAAIAFGTALGTGGGEELDDFADAMSAFAESGPSEIRGDLRVLAEGYRAYVEILGDIDVDFSDPNAFADPEVQARFAEATEIFEDPRFAEAQANVDAFTEANCE